jgi:hypothetical protein
VFQARKHRYLDTYPICDTWIPGYNKIRLYIYKSFENT